MTTSPADSQSAEMDAPPTAEQRYVPGLDGLRAIAILLVIGVHISHRLFPGGHIGVDIFFVLSGFLITGTLIADFQRSSSITVTRFYLRRAARLMPALLALVIIVTAFEMATSFRPVPIAQESLAAALYYMNFLRTVDPSFDAGYLGHTWSLAIEQQFYLIWPLIILLTYRFQFARRRTIVLTISGVWALWAAYLYLSGAPWRHYYFAFDARIFQILAGCSLAVLKDSRWLSRWRQAWPLAALIVLAATLWPDTGVSAWEGWRAFAATFASAGLILEITSRQTGVLSRLMSTPALVYIGKISYSLYLWHYPVLLVVRDLINQQSCWYYPVIIGSMLLATAMASLSYHLIETQFLKLKRRI